MDLHPLSNTNICGQMSRKFGKFRAILINSVCFRNFLIYTAVYYTAVHAVPRAPRFAREAVGRMGV